VRSESQAAENSNGAAERLLTVAMGFSQVEIWLKPTATITSSVRYEIGLRSYCSRP